MIAINAVILLLILAIGYIWSTRGFFSALLHLGCVVAGGAIAFGVWEPAAYALLTAGPDWIAQVAWGAGLLFPFAVITGILTALVNLVIRANAKCDDVLNIVGGGVCGAGVGLITAGFVAISISMIRSNNSLLGFAPLGYSNNGSIIRESGLWIPVDRLVARMYGQMSRTVFATSTPLAVYYPDLAVRGHLMKLGPDDMTLNYAARPDQVSLRGRYTVGETTNTDLNALLADSFDPDRAQKVTDLNDEPLPPGQYRIEGYVITPKGQLREETGQFVFGPGFLTLLGIEPETQTPVTYQPYAMISQAKGDSPAAGRWRFDGQKVFLASVGGASEPAMGFEFLVPKNIVPVALYVKGIRFDLADLEADTLSPKAPFAKYGNPRARDEAIRNGSLLLASASSASTQLDKSQVTPWRPASVGVAELMVSNQVPYNLVLNKGNVRSLRLDADQQIVDGSSKFFKDDMLDRGAERSLRVDKFGVDATTVIVLVDVSPGKAFDMLGAAAANAEGAPTMVDDLDPPQRHQCIGYVYRDQREIHIRYTPGSPITDRSDLPSMTRSRTDQELTLIFRCSLGVKLKYFAIGDRAIKELTPVVKLDTPQGR